MVLRETGVEDFSSYVAVAGSDLELDLFVSE
jgi:hypothetical protein